MSFEQLRPTKKPRVIDLVQQAGMDVSSWSYKSDGTPIDVPAASNPAYCYEWCFTDSTHIVFSLWFDNLKVDGERIVQQVNMRKLRLQIDRAAHLAAGTRTANSKRAVRLDLAVQRAWRESRPIRVIICDGDRRSLKDETRRDPSRVELRLLDPSPWRVESYDLTGVTTGGNAVLVRGQPLSTL
jgi:5-methylcytosine-specific restriction protein A